MIAVELVKSGTAEPDSEPTKKPAPPHMPPG